MAPDGGNQVERGEARVGDDDDPALRQPAPGLEDRLARPVRQLLVPPAAFGAPSLRGRQYRQEGQGPAPLDPGDGDHDHEREPSQPTRLDEVAVGRANRVPIDAAGGDLRSPASLDRVIDADHDRAVGQERLDNHRQELARDGAAVPARPAQNVVIACKTGSGPKPHDAQGRAHRALAGRQYRASHEHQHVIPNRRGEEAAEGGHERDQGRWHERGRGRRGKGGAMSRHRIRRIESRRRLNDQCDDAGATF